MHFLTNPLEYHVDMASMLFVKALPNILNLSL